MDRITRDDLSRLMRTSGPACISILMPTHRAGPERQQDPIRLRNLIKQAITSLESDGMRRVNAQALLSPADDLLDDVYFWDHQADGLAIYISPESTDMLRLPIELEELVAVGDEFELTPLIPAIDPGARFYVLAIAEGGFRCFRAGRYGMTELDIPDAPGNIDEAFAYTEFAPGGKQGKKKNVQPGEVKAHSVGGKELEDMKEQIAYFRKIDHALRPRLANDNSGPVVLAGVEYLMDAYKSISDCKHIADEIITGNPERTPPAELHARAWQIVEPMFAAARNADLARIEEGLSKGAGATELKELLPAAVQGRVDVLAVADGAHVWGVADADGAIADQDTTQRPGFHDLLNVAALHAWTHGGTVHVVPEESIPANAPVAALFRY